MSYGRTGSTPVSRTKKEDMTGRSCLPFWVSLPLVAPPFGISMLGGGKAAPAQILRRYAAANLQCISAAGQKASRGALAESLADLRASILTTPSKSEHTHFVAPLFQAKSTSLDSGLVPPYGRLFSFLTEISIVFCCHK